MRITDEQWQRVSRLLDEALDMQPALHEQWLAGLPAEHADLRETLRNLLRANAEAETRDFLPDLEKLGTRAIADAAAGDLVGPYRLIRELGSGGMASVWLADRADGTLRRQVALKVAKVTFSDGGLAARMSRERDILATLEHPNIARLYDAGVDPIGRPWLAMEYVEGVALDAHASSNALSVRQRLELFLQVARAVAFAHGRLVVHRDLKPANILVTPAGEVRLLDFGIARLLDAGMPSGAQHTQFAVRAFTPLYAAPEQFTGEPVTVSTDVYSLGVLLYELLSGVSPYASFRNTPAVLEEAVLTKGPASASSVASAIDRRALRGDLDNILARALEKVPAERYASVEAFAADVERHLDGRPIVARAPSRWYVAQKFARRNALALGVFAIVASALIVGLGTALWQAREAARQRTIALDRLTEARDASDFMSALLIEGIRTNESVTLDELLERSEDIAESLGQGDPKLRAYAVNFVANWYNTYGLHERAEKFLTRNLEAMPEAPPSRIAQLVCTRAEAWASLGRRDEAVKTLMTEVERLRDEPAVAAQCLLGRARIAVSERDVAAVDYALEAQRLADEGGERSAIDRATELALIGYAWSVKENPDQANLYFSQAMDLFVKAGRAQADPAIGLRGSWGQALINRGTPREALRLFDEAIAISRRRSPNGEPPPALAANRATVLRLLARFDEARPATDYAVELANNQGSRAEQVYALHAKADLARRMGDTELAQASLDEAVARQGGGSIRASGVVGNRHTLFQAQLWADVGRNEEAREAFTTLIGNYTKLQCCGGALTFALTGRAGVLLAEGNVTAAAVDAERALQVARRAQGDAPWSSHSGLAWLTTGRVHRAQGKVQLAIDAFTSASSHLGQTLGREHPDTLSADRALAELQK